MEKYRKIKRIGDLDNKDIFLNDSDEIIVEEKVDGSNHRVGIIDNNIIFGSRNLELEEGTTNAKAFIRAIEFIKEKVKDKDLSKYNGLMLVGENMIKHSLNYNWVITPPFLGFDIFSLKDKYYLDYDEKVRIFNELDIPIVPLVGKYTAKELRELTEEELLKRVPQSKYGDFLAEGIVFKNQVTKTYAKIVIPEFQEQNKMNFGTVKKEATDDTDRIIAEFVTNTRIEKQIFSHIYSGKKLEMSLMQYIPKEVVNDVMAEELQTIIKRKYTINFRRLQKLITKRCLHVIQSMITNQALNDTTELITSVTETDGQKK